MTKKNDQAAHLELLITYDCSYIDLANELVRIRFCFLRWYWYLVWPMDYIGCKLSVETHPWEKFFLLSIILL